MAGYTGNDQYWGEYGRSTYQGINATPDELRWQWHIGELCCDSNAVAN